MRIGELAGTGPPRTRRLAHHRGLDRAERDELSRLREWIGGLIQSGGLELNRRGRDALDQGRLPVLAGQFTGAVLDPAALFAEGEVLLLIREDLLDLDGAPALRLRRYAALQERSRRETVALFLAPSRG